jgi:hypothetical protein
VVAVSLLTAAAVDRARTEERSIVRAWAMRGTVHLLETEDSAWMLPLFEPLLAKDSRRRAVQLGMAAADVDRALALIRRWLRGGEPLSRSELVERLGARGIEINPDRRVHLIRIAVAENAACFGPDGPRGEPDLIAPGAWLGRRPRFDREGALAELASRYFTAFGPATEADFAGWAGLPLRDVRAGMGAIGSELRRVEIGNREGWMLGRRRPAPTAPFVRLLPAWDTYLMGYRDRSFMAPGERWRRIMPGGGMLHPAVLVDGAAVGLWQLRRAGSGVVVELKPFGELGAPTKKAIDAEVADIGRFEDVDATPSPRVVT